MRPVPSRLRVATAGAWHNFVTWGLLTLLGLSAFSIKDLYPLPNSSSPDISGSGVCILASASSCSPSGFSSQFRPPSRLWHYLGYDDISQRGIVITQVQSHSPLYGHLLPGSVITHVDDVRLGTDDSGLESGNGLRRWHSHLGMDPAHWARKVQDEAGWCVPETWFSREFLSTWIILHLSLKLFSLQGNRAPAVTPLSATPRPTIMKVQVPNHASCLLRRLPERNTPERTQITSDVLTRSLFSLISIPLAVAVPLSTPPFPVLPPIRIPRLERVANLVRRMDLGVM